MKKIKGKSYYSVKEIIEELKEKDIVVADNTIKQFARVYNLKYLQLNDFKTSPFYFTKTDKENIINYYIILNERKKITAEYKKEYNKYTNKLKSLLKGYKKIKNAYLPKNSKRK